MSLTGTIALCLLRHGIKTRTTQAHTLFANTAHVCCHSVSTVTPRSDM